MIDGRCIVRVLDPKICLDDYVSVPVANGQYPPAITGFMDPIKGEAAVAPSYFLAWLPGRYTWWESIKNLFTKRRWARMWPATYHRTRGVQVICSRCPVLVTTAVSHLVGDREAAKHSERLGDHHTREDIWLISQEQGDDIVLPNGLTVGEVRSWVGL